MIRSFLRELIPFKILCLIGICTNEDNFHMRYIKMISIEQLATIAGWTVVDNSARIGELERYCWYKYRIYGNA